MIGRGRSVARLDDVTQRYAGAVALDAVTIELPAGCMVGLIGPDGVGSMAPRRGLKKFFTSQG